MRFQGRRKVLFILALACRIGAASGEAGSGRPPAAAGLPPWQTFAGQAGPAPVLESETVEGSRGQAVKVAGRTSVPATQVRLVWLYNDLTRTAAMVSVSAGGAFSAALTVPFDAEAGQVQICAAAAGDEKARFGCIPFLVRESAPGSITASIPGSFAGAPADDSARLMLLDRSGMPVMEARSTNRGSLVVSELPAGFYQPSVIGPVDGEIRYDPVFLRPDEDLVLTARPAEIFPPATAQGCDPNRRDVIISQVGMTPSTRTSSASEWKEAGIDVWPDRLDASPEFDFGVYLTGVALKGRLRVGTQVTGNTFERPPTYELVSPDGKTKIPGEMAATQEKHVFQADINLGDSKFTDGLWKLFIYPRSLTYTYCPAVKTLRFVGDPMKSPVFRQGGSSATAWNAAEQRYEFRGTIPRGLDFLPLRYPNPPPDLPLLGEVRNELDAGLFLEGIITLDYKITFQALNAKAYVKLLSQEVYGKERDIRPKWMNGVTYDPDNPGSLQVDVGPISLYRLNWETNVFRGVLASYFGIVTVNAGVSVGVNGELSLSATIWPLKPGADLVLTPYIQPWLAVSIWVDLLMGLASAGADATASLAVGLPVHLNTTDSRVLYFDSLCLAARIDLAVWARINLGFIKKQWDLASVSLLDKKYGCSQPVPPPAPPPTPPRILGSPAVNVNAQGQMMVVYVADTAPNGARPIPKVFALYKDQNTENWDYRQAVALTDGSHMVQDPTVALSYRKAVVAWTETVMTPQEEESAGNDINRILQRQEICYAVWGKETDRKWKAPVCLTQDRTADGRPVLAAEINDTTTSTFTLAWVRSGGENYNRNETRIAVTEWIQNQSDEVKWNPRQEFDGPGMDAQIAIYQTQVSGNPTFTDVRRFLGWVTGADGADGRKPRLKLYSSLMTNYPYHQFYGEWQEIDTSRLPDNINSPALYFDDTEKKLTVAFLAGNPNAAAAAVDTRARLRVAQRWSSGAWILEDIEPAGINAYAEKPQLVQTWWDGAHQGMVLVYRRFSDPGTNRALGQIATCATTYESSQKIFGRPIYLTDEKKANWLPAAAYNKFTRKLNVLWLQRASGNSTLMELLLNSLPAAEAMALPGGTLQTVSDDPDPLLGMTLDEKPDPALDPQLLFELLDRESGTWKVTARARNVGLLPTGGLAVRLYRGTPGAGSAEPVDSRELSGVLPSGAVESVEFLVRGVKTEQPYYAVIGGLLPMQDYSANNSAAGRACFLERPKMLGVTVSPRFVNSLEISWAEQDNRAVAGYRVCRAPQPEGPWELVGESRESHFADLGLKRFTLYYYRVQAYDAAGNLSGESDAMSGMLSRGPLEPYRVVIPHAVQNPSWETLLEIVNLDSRPHPFHILGFEEGGNPVRGNTDGVSANLNREVAPFGTLRQSLADLFGSEGGRVASLEVYPDEPGSVNRIAAVSVIYQAKAGEQTASVAWPQAVGYHRLLVDRLESAAGGGSGSLAAAVENIGSHPVVLFLKIAAVNSLGRTVEKAVPLDSPLEPLQRRVLRLDAGWLAASFPEVIPSGIRGAEILSFAPGASFFESDGQVVFQGTPENNLTGMETLETGAAGPAESWRLRGITAKGGGERDSRLWFPVAVPVLLAREDPSYSVASGYWTSVSYLNSSTFSHRIRLTHYSPEGEELRNVSLALRPGTGQTLDLGLWGFDLSKGGAVEVTSQHRYELRSSEQGSALWLSGDRPDTSGKSRFLTGDQAAALHQASRRLAAAWEDRTAWTGLVTLTNPGLTAAAYTITYRNAQGQIVGSARGVLPPKGTANHSGGAAAASGATGSATVESDEPLLGFLTMAAKRAGTSSAAQVTSRPLSPAE